MNKSRRSPPTAGVPLGREAERLLAALGSPGAEARRSPLEPGRLVLRRARGGVSVGGGIHSEAAGEALAAADLAAWEEGRFVATDAGRARLRRAAGGDAPFAAQHRDLVAATVETPAGPARVRANAAESPLAWLRRRADRDGEPLIDAAAFEAGERLRRDLTLGGLLPRVTQRWDAQPGGGRGPAEATDAAIAARQRVRAALDAVGPELADLLVDLCGFLKGLEILERDRGWPRRAAKVVVRLALARLADHYGLAREAEGPARSRGIRFWAEASVPTNIPQHRNNDLTG